jgi:uncharacterized PurR-regulated membrane protein YhhQ (DUF165 family)
MFYALAQRRYSGEAGRSGGAREETGRAQERRLPAKEEEYGEGGSPSPPPPSPFPLGATGFMILSVMASNYLVQFPVGDWLTAGSLTYPLAFLVCDVTNKLYGAKRARLVVYAGFAAGLPMSLLVSPVRIAVASGVSFLTSQLVDVTIFDKLRNRAWWQAPLISTCISACLDSYLFALLAFYGDPTMPHWLNLATGDAVIKLVVAAASLGPFRLFVKNQLKAKGKGKVKV